MTADVVFLVSGIALLAAVVLPSLLHKAAISAPIVLLAMGMLIGLLPTPDGLVLDPVENRAVVEHVTEVTVLLALMGVGLALDRPLDLRSWSSIRRWSVTWRLLLLAMPLCIGAVALLGWGLLGLAPATALLLGAVLAPTDPVLASDIQVEGPVTEGHEDEIDEEDEVRFALTSEAGLNDGLAFPFVYAAILAATEGAFASWGAGWFGWELVGKVAVGVLTGLAVGWVLAKIAFRAPSPSLRMAEQGEPLLAFAALLLAYGTSEVLHGYGFLAVFVAAMTLRSAERGNEYHEHMHQVVERLERLMTLFVLLLLGMALTHGLLAHLDWRGALLARGTRRRRRSPASTPASGSSPRSSGCAASARSTTSRTRRGRLPSTASGGCGRPSRSPSSCRSSSTGCSRHRRWPGWRSAGRSGASRCDRAGRVDPARAGRARARR